MTRWSDSSVSPASTLLSAIDADLDLPDETWAELFESATPYQRRVARLRRDPSLAPHGVPSTYTNWGCRCVPCTESRRASQTSAAFEDGPAPEEMSREQRIAYARKMGWDVPDDVI